MKYVLNLWMLLLSVTLWTPQPTHEPLRDLPRLLVGTSQAAVVDRCERVQFRRSGGVGSSATNSVTIFDDIPIAISAEGIEAHGSYRLGKEWCDDQVGKSVNILVHPDDPQRSMINSYVQLWLLPVHLLVVLVLFVLSAVYPPAWRFVFFGYLACASGSVLLELYL
ncbi:hypothetical protein [Pseudaestuariivita rosea]|uniref:hypothetical protein n=1 Tax=Pseudaestuariivita rosea TaxID=2763263 RepID=UPI001ABAC5A3|nr:hypothetical protein [Pseudaestuariivita rosea]